jgi:hypothetical protein
MGRNIRLQKVASIAPRTQSSFVSAAYKTSVAGMCREENISEVSLLNRHFTGDSAS